MPFGAGADASSAAGRGPAERRAGCTRLATNNAARATPAAAASAVKGRAQARGSAGIRQDMDAEEIAVLPQAGGEYGVELRLFYEPHSAWKALAAHRYAVTGRASCGPWRGAR